MKICLLAITLNIILPISGYELAELMENRIKPNDIKSNSTMQLIKKNGKKRTLKLINKSKDNSKKQMIWFLEPKDDYGIAFLKIEHKDDPDFMNMWLPGFKKNRRISSQKKSDSFMGSDLSYEDMTNRDLDEYEFDIIKSEYPCNALLSIKVDELEEKKCYLLSSIPKDEFSEYSKHHTVVSMDNYLAIYEKSFDKNGDLLKNKNLKYGQFDEFYIMNELYVQNIQKNTSTLLKINDIKINNGYKDEDFHSKNLKRVPFD